MRKQDNLLEIDINKVKEYRKRLHSYIVSMQYFKSLLESGDITEEEYSLIERDVLLKYRLPEDSLFRMNLSRLDKEDK